jgi:hypothetical protein
MPSYSVWSFLFKFHDQNFVCVCLMSWSFWLFMSFSCLWSSILQTCRSQLFICAYKFVLPRNEFSCVGLIPWPRIPIKCLYM